MCINLTENNQLLAVLCVLIRSLHVHYDSMHKYLFYYFVLTCSVTLVYQAGQYILICKTVSLSIFNCHYAV